MKAGLEEINQQAGVWGSLIINNRGEIIANQSPASINKAALANIANHVVELLSSAGDAISGLREAVIHYSQRKIFILDLEQAILIVICTPSVDISLLRMTVNVVVTTWRADSKTQKALQANFVERF